VCIRCGSRISREHVLFPLCCPVSLMKNKFFLFGFLTLGLTHCATHGTLPLGKYAETRGPGVVLFEGKELHLHPDHRFEYTHWTDMVGEGRQGRGTYSVRGQQLRLRFDGGLTPPVPQVEPQPGPELPASDSVAVLVTLRHGQAAAAGLTVLVMGEAGRMLSGASSNAAGQARLVCARTDRPNRFIVSGIGFQSVEHPWPEKSSAYAVHLAEQLDPAVPAGHVLTFRVLEQTTAKLILQQGRDTLVLVPSPRP
jgi:hypothetical protein